MKNGNKSEQEMQARYGSLNWQIKTKVSLLTDTEQQIKLDRNTSCLSFRCTKELTFEFKVFKDGKETTTITANSFPMAMANYTEKYFQIPDLDINLNNDEYIFWCVKTTADATLYYKEH